MSSFELQQRQGIHNVPQTLFSTQAQPSSASLATTSFSNPTFSPRHQNKAKPPHAGGHENRYYAYHPSSGPMILDPWRSTLISVTEVFFPRSKKLLLLRQAPKQLRQQHDWSRSKVGDNELHTDMALSVLLHFNTVYMVLWLPILVVALGIKYSSLSDGYRVANLVLYISVALIEFSRLQFGKHGNYGEKVPELALCWVITLLVQLPLVLFLSFNRLSAMKVTPEERGVNIPLAVLLIIQVLIMRRATNKLITSLIAKMQLNDFDDIIVPPQEGIMSASHGGDHFAHHSASFLADRHTTPSPISHLGVTSGQTRQKRTTPTALQSLPGGVAD